MAWMQKRTAIQNTVGGIEMRKWMLSLAEIEM